jgi:myosin protein heavy chain
MENLKMSLETEMRKIEEDLKAERALALDKDDLLARSKKREAELEDEVSALQADLDNLDSQLDRALNIQKASEEKYDNLRAAFDEAAGHLVRLEGEEREWTLKVAELSGQLDLTSKEIEDLRKERDDLQKLSEELKTLASQLEEDLLRAKERTEIATSELEGKLKLELRNRLFRLPPTLIFSDANHMQRSAEEQS